MRINNKDVRARGRRGRRPITVVAVAGLAAMALDSKHLSGRGACEGHHQSPDRSHGDRRIGHPTAAFIAVTPVRILDTRPAPVGPVGLSTPDKLGPGARLDLRLAGDGLIVPASASGVLINITIDEDATLPSYLTVWPLGEPQPFTSANNAYPGLIQANSLVAKLANGGISIFNQRGSVNVVIDLVGYIVPASSERVSVRHRSRSRRSPEPRRLNPSDSRADGPASRLDGVLDRRPVTACVSGWQSLVGGRGRGVRRRAREAR